jgi:hypothetical protein
LLVIAVKWAGHGGVRQCLSASGISYRRKCVYLQ